jgi:hypothetical protein
MLSYPLSLFGSYWSVLVSIGQASAPPLQQVDRNSPPKSIVKEKYFTGRQVLAQFSSLQQLKLG